MKTLLFYHQHRLGETRAGYGVPRIVNFKGDACSFSKLERC